MAKRNVEDLLTEDFSQLPWWWRHAAPVAEEPTDLPDQTDVLVVGSGYAGLSCAVELARAETDVTVVDAGDLGIGASTRAAGFVSGRAGISKQINLEAAVGPERAGAILEEADDAYDHFRNVIATEEIDCDFMPTGRFLAAHTEAAYGKLETKMREYNSVGQAAFEMIPRDRQPEFIRSDAYYGGMRVKNAGSVHPAKYHAGLLRACRAAGVRFVSNTRVQAIIGEGEAKEVQTERGVIKANRVMLGTGGYTDKAAPWHQRRIIPMSSTILATEELGEEKVKSLLPALGHVIDAKRVIFFARPSSDRKHILFGGRARFTPVGPMESVRILHEQMVRVFPELEDVKVSNSWSGLMAFTFDFLPKIGVHDDVQYAMACNGGSGIVMMSWLGRKAAWNMLGTANRGSALEGLPFKTQPFYSGAPWFVPIVGSWYRFRDWMDLRQNS